MTAQRDAKLVRDAERIFRAAIDGVNPANLLAAHPIAEHLSRPVESFRRVVVVGAGKAGIPMASAVELQLGEAITEGFVVVPHGYPEHLPSGLDLPKKIDVVTAGHPVPDANSAEAAKRMLRLARSCSEEDLLLVLISGGGSALLAYFQEGISQEEAREVFRLLLGSGADIHEVNAVRKHLSQIAGGRLALAAEPATVLSLLISDVTGDDPTVIASGPTVPDPTTFQDVDRILRQYRIRDALPASVRNHVERGLKDPSLDSAKPGHPAFASTETRLFGSNQIAVEAARAAAGQLGYNAQIAGLDVTGEARDVAREHVRKLLASRNDEPMCLLWGGETTVTIRGNGKGGRNQELALAAAIEMDGHARHMVLLSGGSDGIDGPTDAAGAWATPATVSRAGDAGLDAQAYLENNDAYHFFEQLGSLLMTGPTHTNVMDVQVGLVFGRP